MTNKFRGKTVIITGGSNGIGKGIAKAFGREGATVCIADLDGVRGEEVRREVEKEGGIAAFIKQM